MTSPRNATSSQNSPVNSKAGRPSKAKPSPKIRKLLAKFARVHWRQSALRRRQHAVDIDTISRNALMYARCRGLWRLRTKAELSSAPEFEYTYDPIEFALQEIEAIVDDGAIHLVLGIFDEVDKVQKSLKIDDVTLIELLAAKMMITMSRYHESDLGDEPSGDVDVFRKKFWDAQSDMHSSL